MAPEAEFKKCEEFDQQLFKSNRRQKQQKLFHGSQRTGRKMLDSSVRMEQKDCHALVEEHGTDTRKDDSI